jgi:hypothetical protein
LGEEMTDESKIVKFDLTDHIHDSLIITVEEGILLWIGVKNGKLNINLNTKQFPLEADEFAKEFFKKLTNADVFHLWLDSIGWQLTKKMEGLADGYSPISKNEKDKRSWIRRLFRWFWGDQ